MATNDPFSEYDDLDDDIGLDAEDRAQVKSNKQDWYKAEKGRVDRVAFVYFNTVDVTAARIAKRKNAGISKDEMIAAGKAALEARAKKLEKTVETMTAVDRLNLNDVRFKKMLAHYQEGLGYVISRLGLDGAEADDAWRRLPEAKQHFTTLLLVYATTRDGEIIKEKLATGWKLLPWRFSPDRYSQICKRNVALVENGITIASQDIQIECKDTQFQNVTIDALGPAIYRKNPKFQELVLTKAVELYEKLSPFRDMTTADLRIKLGLGGGATASVGAEEYGDILDHV
jgi:hypothetical protein